MKTEKTEYLTSRMAKAALFDPSNIYSKFAQTYSFLDFSWAFKDHLQNSLFFPDFLLLLTLSYVFQVFQAMWEPDASVKNVKPEKIIEKIFYIYINAYMFFPYR